MHSPNYCGIFEGISALEINAKINNRSASCYETLRKRIIEDNDIRAVYLCSPMNPLGTQIERLADCVRLCSEREIIVFLDQAYAEFCNQPLPLTEVLINNHLVIGRTFSKAYGLAGIRCGYIATSNNQFLKYLSAIHRAAPYRFSANTLYTASSAINNQDRLDKTIRQINETKNSFYGFLDRIGLKYYKTETNFVPIEVGQYKNDFLSFSKINGIEFADLNPFMLPDFIRITIGTKVQMEKVCNIIRLFFGRN